MLNVIRAHSFKQGVKCAGMLIIDAKLSCYCEVILEVIVLQYKLDKASQCDERFLSEYTKEGKEELTNVKTSEVI